VSALDAKIDDLYRAPLNDFTGARNALAKSLSGDEAKRVRALAKPTLVPWAVNQVYWHARAAYDRLMKSGERVRKAQIAALEGRSADVRAASEAHRHAIAEAVAEAERLAKATGSKPGADALARTFEALSLATGPADSSGRLTQALQPAGFEALVGIKPQTQKRSANAGHAAIKAAPAPVSEEHQEPARRGRGQAERDRKEREEAARERAAEAASQAAARQRQAALKQADAKVARAEAAEKQARAVWERAHDELLEARRKVMELKSER
jgi:colicin import membrane protein